MFESRATSETERRALASRVMMGKAFSVKTPSCEAYIKRLTMWLMTGSQGALVYGRPRLGKTTASRWVLETLSNVVGRVPWVEVPIRAQRIASEREFFQHLLHCVRHKLYLKGTAGDKRDRLAEWLSARASRSPINTVVLFIDEAQLLTEQHYKWLLNIGNELDARGCRLFCLLVGQAELLNQKRKFIDEGQEQFVGRFMVRELEFPGLRSLEDVLSCLKNFDETIYPPKSGVFFIEHFIPLSVGSGFHLEQVAPALWSAFEKAWNEANPHESPVVAMHYFTAALMTVLNSLAKIDRAQLQIPASKIENAVRASGYLESLQSQQIIESV